MSSSTEGLPRQSVKAVAKELLHYLSVISIALGMLVVTK